MLSKIAQMFGLGRAAGAEGAGARPASAASVAPSELPARLAELPAEGRTGLAIAVLKDRSKISPELLQKIAAQLTPVQREQVLAALPEALRALATKSGFDPLSSADVQGSSAQDRARVASSGLIPPSLAALSEEIDLPARIADVRAGRSAISLAERADIRETLQGLDRGQLKALRELLVERPPHPQLKAMRGHPALQGPPTARGVLAIMVGEPLGLSAKPSPELAQRAKEALAEYPYGFAPGVEQQWIDVLAQSPMAIRMVRNNGPLGLEAVNTLGLANLDAAGHPWAEGQTLMKLAAIVPGKLTELRAFADKHGSDAFGDALRVMGKAAQGNGIVDEVAKTRGLEAAVRLATAAADDAHGLKCLRHQLGSDEGVIAALGDKSSAAIARMLADAGARIKEFGDGGAALELGANWPEKRPRTPSIQQAEAKVLAKLGLPADALGAGRSKLSEAQLGAVSRGLMAEIAARSPDQAAMLDRELLGRRFVAPRYFDALYDAGVKNPEHRYSVATFESWRAADAMVRDAAAASRGRPLEAGELTRVMQAAHRMAGSGMVGQLEQSHLKSEDLGRLRSEPKDHVQLGNGFVEVDKETAEKLDRNPYLTPNAVKLADLPSRPIVFAPGVDVPRMVAELDAFVRDNERSMSPSALAAEVHFRLVSIHPFMDGNGRTAKLMADFVLARAGAEPPLWRKGDVMKHVDVWPAAAREGLEFQLDVVKRHFDAVVDVRPRPEARSS